MGKNSNVGAKREKRYVNGLYKKYGVWNVWEITPTNKMKWKRSAEAVGQFGQPSLPSSFLSNSISSSKDCKKGTPIKESKLRISLSDFLDRKIVKTSQKSIQEKQESFSTITFGPINEHTGLEEHGTDFLHNGAVFQRFKHTEKQNVCLQSSEWGKIGEFQSDFIEDKEGSRKRKALSAVSTGGDEGSAHRRHLLVLGDDPKPKHKGRVQMLETKRPKTLFNHYANGSGWWDYNMEGVDSEEVGCNDVWEGMGSTTLGGLEWY